MLGDAAALGVGEHRDLRAEPADRVEARLAQLGDRVLEAGVLGEQREHARDQHDPGHWSPRIARCGGRRPAIVHTMSTVCRVSTTSCTR